MAPSTVSSASQEDLVSDLQSSLQQIKQNKITIGGKANFSVSPAKLEQLERRVDRALAHQGESQASPSALIALHCEIEALKTANTRLAAMLKDAQAAEDEKTSQIKDARAAWKAKEQELKTLTESNVEYNKTLKMSLEKAKADLEQAKALSRTAEAKFDSDAAIVIDEAKKRAASEVSTINKKLELSNASHKKMQEKVNQLFVMVKKKEDELNAMKGQTAQLKNAIHAADDGNNALQFSPTIETMLGKDACLILANWRNVAFDDVKEKAFIGMKGLSRHKNKLLQAIGKLFAIVFQWCKTTTIKARRALKPWVDMVIQDLVSAKLQAVSFYRDELRKLKVIIDEKKAVLVKSGQRDQEEKDGFFSDLWFLGYALVLRIKRRTAPVHGRVIGCIKGAFAHQSVVWTAYYDAIKRAWKAGQSSSGFKVSAKETPSGAQVRMKASAAFWKSYNSHVERYNMSGKPVPPVFFDVDKDTAPTARAL